MATDTNLDNSMPTLFMESSETPGTDADKPSSQLVELELARLRIKELEMRIEWEKLTRDRPKCDPAAIDTGGSSTPGPSNANIITTFERRLELPKRELPRFDGNPKNYWSFIKAFQSTIESRTSDDEARLSYLIQFCEGDAKSQIEHCTVLEPTQGFRLAKEILRKRFGQNHMVAKAFIDELLSGQQIREGDTQALITLAQQLTVCDTTLRQLNYVSDLNSRGTIQSVVRRLPSRLRFKWAKTAANIRQLNREPEVADLAAFIEDKIDGLCSDYGELALSLSKADRTKRPATHSDKITPKRNAHAIQTNAHGCPICGQQHVVAQCDRLVNLAPEERFDVIKRHKLCALCLRPNHMAKDCKSRSVCTIDGCGGKHHSMLHRKTSEKQTTISSHHLSQINAQRSLSLKDESTAVALAIVPVTVKNGSLSMKTFAFLDNGSDSSFISKSLADALQLEGVTSQLTIKALTGSASVNSSEVTFEMESHDTGEVLRVPRAWVVSNLPELKRVIPTPQQIRQWTHLKDIPFKLYSGCTVGILIGSDVPKAHWVLEQRFGQADEPYAVKTLLGWTLLGPVSRTQRQASTSHVSISKIERDLQRFYEQDMVDPPPLKDKEMSIDDRKAFEAMTKTVTLRNGHYEIALPWLSDPNMLPNNHSMALRRLYQLRRRLLQCEGLKERYCKVMDEYISEGYAEMATKSQTAFTWYIPHHPVFNVNKPSKLRIVFDCAASFEGYSLNKHLMSGPDLTNSLFGVLLRFRMEKVAVMADIKSMFHQVRVPENDRDALRFLWWPNHDLQGEVVEYRMCVHLFGATSSPSCASFALKQTIHDNEQNYDPDVIETSKKCFYVDDCLFTTRHVADACRYAEQMKSMLSLGGFDLTKWISNEPDVLQHLHETYTVESVQLDLQPPETHRTLGLNWQLKDDTYCFKVQPMTAKPTRRTILSYVASFYDPLGYIAPVVLVAKQLLQRLCKLKMSWDQLLTDTDLEQWSKWTGVLPSIEKLAIPRCLKGPEFENELIYQLHLFSDASENGYGAVAYLLLINSCGQRSCRLLMSKSRVAPIKPTTIPRLELSAAVMSVKLARQIQSELNLPWTSKYFWLDSQIILHSILNSSKRFPTFFANRLATIHEYSDITEWNYVETRENPADLVSRGVFANENKKLEEWIRGPHFLLDKDRWPRPATIEACVDDDVYCAATSSRNSQGFEFLQVFSGVASWCQLLRMIAWFLRYKRYLRKISPVVGPLSAEDIRQATYEVLRLVQLEVFSTHISILRKTSNIKTFKAAGRSSTECSIFRSLSRLNPILVDGILRVGGRLQEASLPYQTKHPVILPSKHFVTRLLIRHYHNINGHMGLAYLVSSLRQRFWILNATKAIKSVLNNCFQCRRWFGPPCGQAMAPLPSDRTICYQRPFTVAAVDYFGPMFVKRGRTVEKRYGCLFTCLSIRAAHIEVAHSMDTDSFLCAFNRFVARRGCPQRLYSDNGSNFKGGELDIKTLMRTWNQEKIKKSLLVRECDWIFNPPKAYHRGGAWERIIRSIKRVLTFVLEEQPMTDEVLHTTLLEIERILNDRPLVQQTDQADDQYTLSPSKLLLLGSNESVVVPAEFTECRFNRRWRQAQYLADLFWRHWIKRYLPTLQVVQKWRSAQPNLKVGELVLILTENAPRGRWPKAIVEQIFNSPDGLVREVLVRTSSGTFRRDVRQLCRLEGETFNEDPSEVELNGVPKSPGGM